jgi:hypothetical protein
MAGQMADSDQNISLEAPPERDKTVGDHIKARFHSIEASLAEEINAVRQTGMADPRLAAVALTQLEIAFAMLQKALVVGSQPR